MKVIVSLLLLFSSLLATDATTQKYIKYLQNLPTKTKKYRFFKLILPPVLAVDKELRALYLQTLHDVTNNKHPKRVTKLMQEYKATSKLDLLKRIKPHPVSITLAQAAIESAWGTSRFFIEAHNIFGMWSKSKDPKEAIKASSERAGGRVIYLRKYKNYKEAIKAYYKNLATNKAYKCFREARYFSDDPYELVSYLHKYSEKKELYPVELIKIIKHNNLTKYDTQKPLPRYIPYKEAE